MASVQVKQALAQVSAESDLNQKRAAFETLLGNIKNMSSPSAITTDLETISTAVFDANLGVVLTRQVLTVLIASLRALSNDELWLSLTSHILSLISAGTSASSSSLLDEAAELRELAATAHEHNEDFAAAAAALAEIPLDSSQRRVTDADKVRVWIRIVRDLLEVDNTTQAETYLNKLKNVMHTIEDPELTLHFRLSSARIMDAKRQFLAAAQAYHEISNSAAVAEEERLLTLSMAIKCAILAPAGPLRSRVLGRLYKDERAEGVEEYSMLEKMFLDRLLAPAEVSKFAEGLAPHQLALTADGSTVLEKAVLEHNLIGASRLYSNIEFDALGALLGLDKTKAEDTTARMIEQGRLVGRIDQIDDIVYFERGEASGEKGSGRAEVIVGKEMRRWDANVLAVAEEVESITAQLQAKAPDFVQVRLTA